MNAGSIKTPVPSSMGAAGYVWRPNRNAAGATRTDARKPRRNPGQGVGLALSVRGTLDALAPGLTFLVTRKDATPCPCCGGTLRKLRLNENGKLRLRVLRKKRAR